VLEKLPIILQTEDLIKLSHVKVHVEIAFYFSKQLEDSAGHTQKFFLECMTEEPQKIQLSTIIGEGKIQAKQK
jgi:hypothetical protein